MRLKINGVYKMILKKILVCLALLCSGCDFIVDQLFEKDDCRRLLASPEPEPFNCKKYLERTAPTVYEDGSVKGIRANCASASQAYDYAIWQRNHCRDLLRN
jgi:hypothetical protein